MKTRLKLSINWNIKLFFALASFGLMFITSCNQNQPVVPEIPKGFEAVITGDYTYNLKSVVYPNFVTLTDTNLNCIINQYSGKWVDNNSDYYLQVEVYIPIRDTIPNTERYICYPKFQKNLNFGQITLFSPAMKNREYIVSDTGSIEILEISRNSIRANFSCKAYDSAHTKSIFVSGSINRQNTY